MHSRRQDDLTLLKRAAKNHERALCQNFDKHQFLEFRPVDISREGVGGLRKMSTQKCLGRGMFLVTKSIYESFLIDQ